MKNRTIQGLLVLIVLAAIVSIGAFYVVREGEQVVITQFGKPVGTPVTKAGLHFKLPFIQKVNRFEKRILKWDGSPNQIPTKDKKLIWVDTTARWRISDPLRFLTRVTTMTTALSRLDGIIDSVVRDAVSNNNLVDLVRGEEWEGELEAVDTSYGAEVTQETVTVTVGRESLMQEMLDGAEKLTPEFGIELVDVRIKRVNYVETVLKKVFERMISERKRIAAQYRSEGEGEAARITGQMSKELKRISSEAFRQAEEIKGRADAEATRIYGDAFNQDPGFYSFFQTLELYRNQEGDNTRLILTTESDFYQYLKKIPR
ncbi:MAG: protease modulator HflC [Deltaproteobacteria bacterium]|nr:MAG: protease modulator HflC [Deltaproteobacteria bacterium]